MIATFEQDGLAFRYPGNWTMSEEETGNGWTVTVQSPDTAFFILSFDADMPDPTAMADSALEAMQSEYKDLESENVVGSVAGQPAVGHDIEFISFDLTNTCWLRAFPAGGGTALALWQANDLELDQVRPVLNAIVASLSVDD